MNTNILLGVTGSVAATLTLQLTESLKKIGNVKVVSTKSALHFFKIEEVDAQVLTDEDEWGESYERGQPVLHIDLSKWADVLLIAPLSADTLAKLAHGRCDNLLTCVVRAWDMKKPLVVAPSMNTHMWEHSATSEHLSTLERWHGDKLHIIDPVEKTLACGDVGMGAMASIDQICSAIQEISS